MNVDWYFTNEDCTKCCYSHVIDNSSEYESHYYGCSLGHNIDGQMDVNRKGCDLPSGEYYESSTKVWIKKKQ